MSSVGAAPRAAVPVSSARAEASRKNGARSRGPVTPEGKARSAQNALRHGLRAEKYVVLPDEDAAAYAALEAALRAELAPQGVLQSILVGRIAHAAWRLDRAERIEVQLFEERRIPGGNLGLCVIRDGNGTRSFETLLRYRASALAELWRALRTLKALQAEQSTPARAVETEPAAVLLLQPKGRRAGAATLRAQEGAGEVQPRALPIEPEARAKPGESAPALPPAPELEQPPAGPARARTNEPESPALALAHLRRGPQPNEPGPALAQREAAAGPGARRAAPGAIAPPRERRPSGGGLSP
jgi:hypothetical protein